jgi:hypothetical protein
LNGIFEGGAGDNHEFGLAGSGRDNGERERERERDREREKEIEEWEREGWDVGRELEEMERDSGRRWREKTSPRIRPGLSREERARVPGPGPGEVPDIVRDFPARGAPETVQGAASKRQCL